MSIFWKNFCVDIQTLRFAGERRNLYAPMSATLIQQLAATCVEAREAVKMEPLDVQLAFERELRPQTIKTIERFELGETWPREIEATVDAYAKLAGVDPADLWRRAIDRWQAELKRGEADQQMALPPKVPKAPRPAPQRNPAKRRQGAGS